MRLVVAYVIFCLFLPLAAQAEKRIGLVIGNDSYSDVPALDKARADAHAVAAALTAQGFDIITVTDADRRDMNRQISRFTSSLQPGDTAFVFFAGHGVEIDGENYLLPTDIIAPASGERDFIKSESIPLSGLLDRIRATGARTTIAIVDACRNNPFEQSTGRSIGSTRGLGRLIAPQGTFVIFSAGAGQLALDRLNDQDRGANSVFTRMLVPRLGEPGLELRAMMAGLRRDVRDLARTVNHDQFPAYYDELLGNFYFAAAPAPPVAVAGDETPTAPALAPDDRIRADFDLARSLDTVDAYDAFIERYRDRPGDFTVQLATQLRDKRNAEATGQASRSPQEPEPDPITRPDVVAASQRDLIQQTQTRLNALGCNAGGADGVIGGRTRAAFARFIGDTGAELSSTDLGTPGALQALNAARSGCKTVEAAAAPAPGTATSSAVNLAGTWNYRATCALLIKVTGSIRYTRSGSNTFKGQLSDSLGQHATTRVTISGRKISTVDYFPGVTVRGNGRLSADGNAFSLFGSTGCSISAWRVN